VEAVDVLLGNEEDFSAALGFSLEGVDESHTGLDVDAYERLHREVLAAYPNLSLVATSLREAHTATVNDWSAVCSTRDAYFVGPKLPGLEIFDRVGGGDSFASGLIYGLLAGADVETSLAYGVAHGALAMTTPGDTSMSTLAEVERVMRGGAARVVR
jgi:2-dehydro-3-deoxygluconokinase